MIVSDQQLAAFGGSAPFGDVISDAAAIQALARDPASLIQRVLVQSEWTPDVKIDYPLRPRPPGGEPPSAVVRLLKPKVTLNLAPPFRPFVIAPAGEPGRNKWVLAEVAAAVVGVLAIKGAWDLIRGK